MIELDKTPLKKEDISFRYNIALAVFDKFVEHQRLLGVVEGLKENLCTSTGDYICMNCQIIDEFFEALYDKKKQI